MIRYNLVCADGHRFEGWFRDSNGFEAQISGQALSCPDCGSPSIEKALMTPGLPVRSNARKTPAPQTTTQETLPDLATPDSRATAFRTAMRALRHQVETNADYVGDRFAEEARRIYYTEPETTKGAETQDKAEDPPTPARRGIYGEATLEDAKALREEGIDVLPLPILPEDKN